MEYYEKRECNEGYQYVRVFNLVPGVTYYTSYLDENNQLYFTPALIPSIDATVVPMTDMSVGGNSFINIYPPYPPNPITIIQQSPFPPIGPYEIGAARSLHFGITITSIFILGLIYLIGFPFCFVRLRNLAMRSSDSKIIGTFNHYTGVGWTAWVFHLLSVGIFAYPVCCVYLSAFVFLLIIPCLALIFTIVVCILGAEILKALQGKDADCV